MPRIAKLLALLACLAPLQGMPADAPTDERTAAYNAYRADFEAGNFREALPRAVRVVELTTSQFGEDAPELANPLTNLATTLYRLGQHGEALDNYRRALTVLDLTGNATDRRLIAPLHGLGATLSALQRHEEAIVPLKRAVDILRNSDGLHATSQLPVLRALIEAYEKTGRRDDASREHQYAFNVAEQAFGSDDPRMIAQLGALASWHEKTGRYTAARLLHMRAVQLADREQPGNLKAVDALRGIARTFRLAFVNGETQDAMLAAQNDLPPSLAQAQMGYAMAVPSGEGERALRTALQRLETAGADKAAERGEVLIELGDWYRIAGAGSRAMTTWIQAWGELSAAGDTSALEKPAAIIYRPPPIATSQRQQDPEQYGIEQVSLRLSIATDGTLREATVANPADERESAERAVLAAVRRATWRPAFAGGVPVAVTVHEFNEQVYVRLPEQAAAEPG